MSRLNRPIALLLSPLVAVLLTAVIMAHVSQASLTNDTTFVATGGGYEYDTLDQFTSYAADFDSDDEVNIVVLPVTYPSDAYSITQSERQLNLSDAQNRADQLQDSCEFVTSAPTICTVTVADIQIQADAKSLTRTAVLTTGVDGIYALGGDQTIAMRVLADTPAETALQTLHQSGVPFGGTSAGAAVQSRYMIAGYTPDGWPWYGLEYGAIETWYSETLTSYQRGLAYGVTDAVIDQHFLERGRLGRLLNATARKPGENIGLGIDWGTSVAIHNNQLITDTAGWYAALVVDQETYSAAHNAIFTGTYDVLSIQDVALHLLPEGPYGYDLATQRPVISGVTDVVAPDISDRTFEMLTQEAYSGTLLVTGDLYNAPEGKVTQRFVSLAQAQPTTPTVVVLVTGMLTPTESKAEAEYWADVLTDLGLTDVQTATLASDTETTTLKAQLTQATAVFVTGNDQANMADSVAQMQAAGLDETLRRLLGRGAVLLFDNAAGAAVGARFSAEPTPTSDNLIFQASDSFVADYIRTTAGLNLVTNAVFEPRIMYDYRYGWAVQHLYEDASHLVIGIERGTAVEISAESVQTVGQNPVLLFDGRYSRILEPGDNDVFAATWLLLDTYAPNELIYTIPITVPTYYTLTVNQVGSGTITQTPTGTLFTAGTPITLTATPDAGWEFEGWSGACTDTNDCYFTIMSNTAVTATFKPLELNLPTIYLPLLIRGD